ncbi:YbfB/YjiJ family MFS transporter [Herbaspirillum sp. 1130]|uniref:YbfB/YjiJ family MFS transporter n=1 Tax=Herbaspirillum sp. 1130 TaxID=2806562 RepID=UPI001AE57ED1|nr:YbfB/YjiJ family MFS transporter [Herbaspirillum sp. 1130]MBP1317123.1 putative MFS family arabinose efflux permease [Herbaspirillum sp. 1130]
MKSAWHIVLVAVGVSFAATISLGLARFSFALLLPQMREDLSWSYLIAGSMNTANAVGYLCGAIVTPALMRKHSLRSILLLGATATTVFMAITSFTIDTTVLLVLRYLTGIASAFAFVTGGILTARLATIYGRRIGLILGVYYGGAGVGIFLSALFIPAAISYATSDQRPHPWQVAWLTLAVLGLALTFGLARSSAAISVTAGASTSCSKFKIISFAFGLFGYGLFGVGYIGYMTFIVAYLREQGITDGTIGTFYTLLGIGVCLSPFLWGKLLDRYKAGQPMAILNFLLSVATAIPLFSNALVPLFISGVLFGSVFLSVVASTTALVRHNLPQASWSAGISAFTTVFALGQIVGPAVTGWISDGEGGLERGFIFSAATLLAGAIFASRQRSLSIKED